MGECKEHRGIVISPLYLVSNTPRGIRTRNIVKYLHSQGWCIDVFCQMPEASVGNIYKISKKENMNGDDITVHSIKNPLQRLILPAINVFNKKDTLETIIQQPGRKEKKMKSLKQAIRSNLIYDPDLWWSLIAIRHILKQARGKRYRFVMSSALPYWTHLTGYIIARRLNIPLILEYGDLGAFGVEFMEMQHLSKYIIKALEKRILEYASHIIVTTEEIHKGFLNAYPELKAGDITAVYSGFDPDDFPLQSTQNKTDKFVVTYTGNIYSPRGSLSHFFEALAELINTHSDIHKDLRLYFVGNIHRKEEIPDVVYERMIYQGPVDFYESLSIMQKSTVLFLLGNKYGFQIPLKTYYYLGAQRPILCLLGDKNDPLRRLLHGYKRVVMVETKEEIKEAILYMYNSWKRGDMKERFELDKVYSEFTWEHQLSKLDDIMEKVMGER